MKIPRTTSKLDLYTGDLQSVKFKPLLFIDFEYITSSFRENGRRTHIQEIIEVAGVLIKDDFTESFSKVIRPSFYLNKKSKPIVNKFTDEELLSGVDFAEAVNIVEKYYIPNKTKVISWGGSDFHNINHLCKTFGIKFYIKKDDYVDLSQKFRRFYSLNQAVTLEKALSILKLNIDYEKHRALPDTRVLLEVFNCMVSDGYLDFDLISNII